MKLGLLITYTEAELQTLKSLGLTSCELLIFPHDPLSPSRGATADEWKRAGETLAGAGIEVSAIGSYTNNLAADAAARPADVRHLEQLIEFAPLLSCNVVGT